MWWEISFLTDWRLHWKQWIRTVFEHLYLQFLNSIHILIHISYSKQNYAFHRIDYCHLPLNRPFRCQTGHCWLIRQTFLQAFVLRNVFLFKNIKQCWQQKTVISDQKVIMQHLLDRSQKICICTKCPITDIYYQQ